MEVFTAGYILLLQSVILLWTPGPATLSIMICGINRSIKQAAIYTVGIWIGYMLNLGIVFLLGDFLFQSKQILHIMQVVFSIYIIYFAYKISGYPEWRQSKHKSSSSTEKSPSSEKFTLATGFLLSMVNPKAYSVNFIMFLSFFSGLEANISNSFIFFLIIGASDFIGIYLYAFGGNIFQKLSHFNKFILNIILSFTFLFVTLYSIWSS